MDRNRRDWEASLTTPSRVDECPDTPTKQISEYYWRSKAPPRRKIRHKNPQGRGKNKEVRRGNKMLCNSPTSIFNSKIFPGDIPDPVRMGVAKKGEEGEGELCHVCRGDGRPW